VVPITDRAGAVAAVLDVDSHRLGAFDEVDRVELESLVLKLRPYLDAGVAAATP
jgi:putative methionine-R-sulfoxide reductase with GAF domain